MANIARHEHDLLVYATEALQSIPGLHLMGTAKEKAGVLSFVLDGLPHRGRRRGSQPEGIAVRAGITALSRSCGDFGFTRGHGPRIARALQHLRGNRRARSRRYGISSPIAKVIRATLPTGSVGWTRRKRRSRIG
jgi:hypothetical protein